MDRTFEIAGAGPAGLAAAIALARAGARVVVPEAHRDVGMRHRGDLQGLENWTSAQDALRALADDGVPGGFDAMACTEGIGFDARGERHRLRSDAPIFYVVERGPGERSLDRAMLGHARALGVEVRFGSRVRRLAHPGIYATGPRGAYAIAAGYHFETRHADGFWIVLDDALAPGGYAYLLVMRGRATMKSCMFAGFRQQALHVRRTVEAFRRLVGIEMGDARFHAGAGHFAMPQIARAGAHPVAGEQAGFQDFFAGFGMRIAMRSGVLAARALLGGEDYEAAWRRELAPAMNATVVVRAGYRRLGNLGYRALLACAEHTDARRFMHRLYRPSAIKRVLAPIARHDVGGRASPVRTPALG